MWCFTAPDGTVPDLTFDSDGYLSGDQRAAGTSSAHTIAVTRNPSGATPDLPRSVSDGTGRSISTTYGSRRSRRCTILVWARTSAAKILSKAPVNLASRSWMRKRSEFPVAEVHVQVAGLLGGP